MAIDYTLHPGEAIPAYNARIAAARAATAPAAGNAPTGSTAPSSAMSSTGLDPATVNKMMQDAVGSISSSNDTIDASISAAIQSQKDAATANAAAVESQFGREAAYQAQDLNQQRTSLLESGRGNAQGAYGLQLVDQQIEKSMRDLEQRKQEMVLQGNAAAASKISDLQVQQLGFKQQAQQQVFSNLLAIGNYGLQAQQVNIASRAQDFQESNAISTIALRYGLDIQPGETIDSITTRAKINASAEEQLNLDRARQQIAQSKAETARANAETNRIITENKYSNNLDASTIKSLARAAIINPNVLATIKNPQQLALTTVEMSNISQTNLVTDIADYISSGKTREDAMTSVLNNPLLTDKTSAISAVNKAYDNEDKIYEMSRTPITLPGIIKSSQNIKDEAYNSIGQFLFADKWNILKTGTDLFKDFIR